LSDDNGQKMAPSGSFVIPTVDSQLYRKDFWLLGAAVVAPLCCLPIDLSIKQAEWFAPSGAISLFLVAFVQFKQLSLLQNKHFTNAQRACRGGPIQLLSDQYRKLERCSFWVALCSPLWYRRVGLWR
jgi:hypothetical protein